MSATKVPRWKARWLQRMRACKQAPSLVRGLLKRLKDVGIKV